MSKTICFPNAPSFILCGFRCAPVYFVFIFRLFKFLDAQWHKHCVYSGKNEKIADRRTKRSNTKRIQIRPIFLRIKPFSDYEYLARTRPSSTDTNVSNVCTWFLRRMNGEKSWNDKRALTTIRFIAADPRYGGEGRGRRRITSEMCLWETGGDLLFWARFSREVSV